MRKILSSRYFLVLALCVFIFVLNSYVFKNFLQNSVYWATAKTGTYFSELTIRSSAYIRVFFNLQTLMDSERRLTQENQLLAATQAANEKLARENAQLRQQLNLRARRPLTLVEAKIF